MKIKKIIAYAAVLAPLPLNLVFAKEGDSLALEQIEVTAQKRAQRINDVPISISAMSGDQLSQRGVFDTSQLEKVVPGFTYQPSTFGAPVYYIRGVGFYETTLAVSPAVSLYIDEMPIPFSVMSKGAVFDLKRVEVLKGPQGTLFGQNATGGAINYIAARPTEEFEAGVTLGYGRFNQLELGGHVSGALTDTLSGRFAVRSETRDEWQKSSSRDDELGEKDFVTGRFILDWAPSDSLEFSLMGSAWSDKSDSKAYQFVGFELNVPCPPLGPGAQAACDAAEVEPIAPNNARYADWTPGTDYSIDEDYKQLALTTSVYLTDSITLTALTNYAAFDSFVPLDADGMAYLNQYVGAETEIDSFSQELRLAGDFGDTGSWMLGVNYGNDESVELQFVELGSSNSDGFDSLYNSGNQNVTSKAIFGGIEFPLYENFELSLSARQTWEDRDFDGCVMDSGNGQFAGVVGVVSNLRRNLPPFPPESLPTGDCVTLNAQTSLLEGRIHRSLDDENFSWRSSLSYNPSYETMLYFTVSKGYKSGSFPLIPGLFDAQYEPATQESVLAYELGSKMVFWDNRAQLNGAIYAYDYSDKQVRGFVDVGFPFGNVPVLVNVPESSAWGIELDLTVILSEHVRASLASNYLETEVDGEFYTPDPLGAIHNIDGEEFPSAPQWQMSADMEYRFNPTGSLEIFIGASYSYRDSAKSAFGPNPILSIDSYELVDLRAGLESSDGSWTLDAYVNNAFDEFYWTQVTREIDSIVRSTAMPRTYGVRLSMNF